MIDPVALDRLELALETGRNPRFTVPIPTDERWEYYRELVYMGYTTTSISRILGWNGARIQAELRERGHRRTPGHIPRAPIYLDAEAVDVDCRPGAIVLTIDGRPHIIEGHPESLLILGRLVYGAASDQQHRETA